MFTGQCENNAGDDEDTAADVVCAHRRFLQQW